IIMGRLSRSVPWLAVMLCLSAGCGGGNTSSPSPPPPPTADFAISLSPSTLTVPQGATSSGIRVTVTAQNGFSGTVQVTLNGIPAGVAASPAGPFPLAAGASTTVLFSASSTAPTGNFSISAQGASGGLLHSAELTLTVQASATSGLPRTSFIRTD